jgi:hypothetical protein
MRKAKIENRKEERGKRKEERGKRKEGGHPGPPLRKCKAAT